MTSEERGDNARSGILNDDAAARFAHPSSGFRAAGLIVIFLLAASFAAGLFVGSSGKNSEFSEFTKPPSMHDCMTDTLRLLDLKQPPSAENLRQAVGHCYSLLHSQGLLGDFAIRELNYAQQYRANGVLMWLVVVITLSGVLLAGMQLLASYRLAEANKGALADNQEISLRRDQLVLKSSVTGLSILVLSFAFFLAFVFYVYRFDKSEEIDARAGQQTPTLPMGGLGPPASEPKAP